MTETAKLLRLFRVDQQLRGLRTRLDAAERFLAEQERQHKDISARHTTAAAQLKQFKTAVASDENEAATVETRIARIREQMNGAKNNKEYSAFLSELNALKARKEAIEKDELEQMQKVENLDKETAALAIQLAERVDLAARARTDRDAKDAEIRDRLNELQAQRDTLRAEIPERTAKEFDDWIRQHGDEAMAHVEELDRRHHEWTCGACQRVLPVETLNHIHAGRLVRCANCRAYLYTDREVDDIVSKTVPKEVKERKPRATKKPAPKPDSRGVQPSA